MAADCPAPRLVASGLDRRTVAGIPQADRRLGRWRMVVSSPDSPTMHAFEISEVKERLTAANGGYEVVHDSPGLELGVYVLVAPEPDRQQPHEDDEVYVVLEGTGILEVEGASVPVKEGSAVFVEAGADHRFTAYEHLSVLVIFERKPAGNP
jgi:mannose-6-phosphate isomerase-like protein (cupin superfamily)